MDDDLQRSCEYVLDLITMSGGDRRRVDMDSLAEIVSINNQENLEGIARQRLSICGISSPLLRGERVFCEGCFRAMTLPEANICYTVDGFGPLCRKCFRRATLCPQEDPSTKA